MSRYPCNSCGSSDGVAKYANGSYCFACNVNRREWNDAEVMIIPNKLELPKRQLFNSWPEGHLAWLEKYDLDNIQTDWFWSQEYKRICFPYYTDDINGNGPFMVACWMRSLTEQPKWLYTGNKNISWYYRLDHSVATPNTPLVLVEDVISAIKVSKHADVICLGGTKLKQADRDVLTCYREVILFLDVDKAGQEAKEKLRKELKLTHKVKVLRNKRDPKCYSEAELKRILIP